MTKYALISILGLSTGMASTDAHVERGTAIAEEIAGCFSTAKAKACASAKASASREDCAWNENKIDHDVGSCDCGPKSDTYGLAYPPSGCPDKFGAVCSVEWKITCEPKPAK